MREGEEEGTREEKGKCREKEGEGKRREGEFASY